MKDSLPIRPAVTARKHGPDRGRACRQIRDCSRATPSFRHASGDTFSSRLTPVSHPVCRAADGYPLGSSYPGYWCLGSGFQPLFRLRRDQSRGIAVGPRLGEKKDCGSYKRGVPGGRNNPDAKDADRGTRPRTQAPRSAIVSGTHKPEIKLFAKRRGGAG